MIKLCRDCAHLRVRANDLVCLASPFGISPVTGEDRGYWQAIIQRESMSPDKCGEMARKFVPIKVSQHASA